MKTHTLAGNLKPGDRLGIAIVEKVRRTSFFGAPKVIVSFLTLPASFTWEQARSADNITSRFEKGFAAAQPVTIDRF